MSIFGIGESEEEQIKKLVVQFPVILNQAISDYAKFKLAVSYGLYNPEYGRTNEYERIVQWFSEFPKMWDGIKGNFDPSVNENIQDRKIYNAAEKFVSKLRSGSASTNQLGAPWILIAGIIVAAIFGLGGAIWAVGYVKDQDNISEIIDQAVAGNISQDVLAQAVNNEQSSIFSGLTDTLKWVVLAAGAFFLLPIIFSGFGSK